ncbi:MAG: hypothetical protein P4L00_04040 [Candidatus Acidoferrales bacterium]|nr:hypothetical protein [Candidatus Acidoferrales bacterium]
MINKSIQPDAGSNLSSRRIVFGVLGAVLIVSGAILAWSFGKDEYYEFYLIPKDKGDPLFPRRWQDLVFLGCFWSILFAWLGLGCWSLRRAFRKQFSKPLS